MYLDQRAWVALSVSVTGPLDIRRDAAFLPLDMEVVNLGHSPARYVKTWGKLSRQLTYTHCLRHLL
jgi:hypothetical protein